MVCTKCACLWLTADCRYVELACPCGNEIVEVRCTRAQLSSGSGVMSHGVWLCWRRDTLSL